MVKKHLTSYRLAWLLVALGTFGLVLSACLVSDSRWTQWYLSYLGQDDSTSAVVFNGTLVVAAIVLAALAAALFRETRLRRQAHPRILPLLLIGVAVGWAGVAFVPYNRAPHLHDMFGYGQTIMACVSMVLLRRFKLGTSTQVYYIGVLSVVVVGLLLGVHHTAGQPPILYAELAGQCCFYVWILRLTHDIKSNLR